jgi:hypothetical protein
VEMVRAAETGQNLVVLWQLKYGRTSDDSLSPSPLLHGAEARQWAKITDQLDLMDLYFTAAVRTGPRYTRQAVRGGVLQQARVDRIHVNNRGEWMEYVEVLEHDGGQALSDSSSAS